MILIMIKTHTSDLNDVLLPFQTSEIMAAERRHYNSNVFAPFPTGYSVNVKESHESMRSVYK